MKIEDSGERREFGTGAVRDRATGKGRFDLMPIHTILIYMIKHNFQGMGVVSGISDFADDGDVDRLYDTMEQVVTLAFNDDFNYAMLELAKHFEEGCDKYGDRNWQKGIPINCYIDSALRHYFKYMAGMVDEPHDRVCLWNIVCAIWTCENYPTMLAEYLIEKDKL